MSDPSPLPPKSRSGLWVLLACIAALLAGIGILWARPPAPETAPPAAEKPVPVAVAKVGALNRADRTTLSAQLEPWVAAELSPQKPGLIVELAADKGDRVRAGQILLRIDDRAWRAILQKAEIDVRDSGRDLERWEQLKKTGAVSGSDFDKLATRNALAQASLEEARAHVAQCELKSPIDGEVADRYVQAGEYGRDGTPAFKVVCVDPLKLALDVPERDIGALAVGQPVALEADALPGCSFTGTVTFVSPVAAKLNNAFRTEARVPNPEGRLRAGMLARVSLARRGPAASAVAVPLTAVVPQKGEHVVFVVKDGRAVRRRVKLEAIVGQEAILSEGVQAGESLVVAGQRALQDGMPVVEAEAVAP